MKTVTIYDIANALNLSPTTVSRCLAGRSISNPETKEKVIEAAKSLGYLQNPFAKSLSSRKIKEKNIAVIVPEFNNSLIIGIISGIEKSASRSGYNLFVCQSFGNPKEEKILMQLYFRNNISGLFIWSDNIETLEKNVQHFMTKKIPIISLNYTNTSAFQYIKKVPVNYQTALDQAIAYLRLLGCSNITFLLNSRDWIQFNINKLIDSDIKQYTFDFSSDFGPLFNDLSLIDVPYNGIIFSNSEDAVSFRKNLNYNSAIIIAFNHDPLTALLEPSLSFINMDGEKYGACAMEVLLSGKATDMHVNSYQYELITRTSHLNK